jgi:ATP sulfurylase
MTRAAQKIEDFFRHRYEKEAMFNVMVYLEDKEKYVPDNEVLKDSRVLNISETGLRQRLNVRTRHPRLVYVSRCRP